MRCTVCKEETDDIYSNGVCGHCAAMMYAELEGERFKKENYQEAQTAHTSSIVPIAIVAVLLLLLIVFVLYSLFARG